MLHLVCLLNVESDRASFTWSEGPAQFEPYRLTGGLFADFVDLAEEARERLADVVKDYMHDAENLPRSTLALAEAGYELYLQMFEPGAEQGRSAAAVRQWLESLTQSKSVDTLEIVVETPWSLPWNVVYDEPPDRDAFLSNDPQSLHWKPFWGVRYNLTGGRRVSPLRRLPLLDSPHVVMVVDPMIRDGLPAQHQADLRSFAANTEVTMVESKQDLVDAVKTRRPDLLYWMSHATPDALVLGNDEITPRQLRRIMRRDDTDNPFDFGGVAFLNACQTAESRRSGSFFDALHSIGFSGMVGTEHQTIDTFANSLGLDFLREFLIDREPLGTVMRRLRARVPLGLLYGTYCPPELRVGIPVGGAVGSVVIVNSPVEIGMTLGISAAQAAAPLPDSPYRSLGYYTYGDRALFAGREADIERFATLLDMRDARMLVLHGESGVGKTSFLRAGVIPYLEDECVGYRFLRGQFDSQEAEPLFARATNDLAGAIAQVVAQFCEQPFRQKTPSGESVELDLKMSLEEVSNGASDPARLRAELLNDPGLLSRILSRFGQQLPFAPILVIDQAEEMFTLARTSDDLECRKLALAILRRAAAGTGDFKIILSMRTEYYGRLIDGLRSGLHNPECIREYLLTDFDESALLAAITRPTSTAEAIVRDTPHSKYGFSFEIGVAEEIAHRVSSYSIRRRDSVLPLMQVICTQLYNRMKRNGGDSITHEDLQAVGGIEGGMRSHVETMITQMLGTDESDKKQLKMLFTQLYVRQPDGSLTTALLREDNVRSCWNGQLPFDDLLQQSQELRLLRANTLRIGGDDEASYVSLGHDALAKLAAEWDEEFSKNARVQKVLKALIAVSALAAVLLALSMAAWVGWHRADRNLNLAINSIDNYYTRVSNEKLLYRRGMQRLRHELTKDAIEDYHLILAGQQAADGDGDPEVVKKLSESYYRAGRIAVDIGELADGQEFLEKALVLQQALREKHQINLDAELSDTRTELGNAKYRLEERKPKSDQDWSNALEEYAAAESLRRRLLEHEPTNELKRKHADVLMNIGLCQWKNEELNKGRDLMAQAQAIRKSLLESEPSPELQFEFGKGSYNLTRLEMDAGSDEEAHRHRKDADEAFTAVLDQRPDDMESAAQLGYATRLAGELHAYPAQGSALLKSLTTAIEHYQNAAKHFEKLADDNPLSAPEYRYAAADLRLNIGDAYLMRAAQKRAQGQSDAEDLGAAEQALELAKRGHEALAPNNPGSAKQAQLAQQMLNRLHPN